MKASQGFRGHVSLLGLVGTLLLGACGGGGASTEQERPAGVVHELKSAEARVAADASEARSAAESEQDFAFEFLQQLDATKNQAFSAHSMSVAFAMLSDAAAGSTLSEVEQSLSFGAVDEAFHRSHDALGLQLAARNRAAISTDEAKVEAQILNESNDIWIRSDIPPEPSLLDTLARFYGAGVHQADFGKQPEQARLAINGKVASDTNQLITELIPKGMIDNLTLAVLTNALYFKAPWTHELADPQPGPFQNLDGSSTTAQMLAMGTQNIYKGSGFVSVALPYYGNELELLMIVPDAGAYESVRADLTGTQLREIVTGRTAATVAVTFPEFSLKSTIPAKEVLQKLGMQTAFDPELAELPKFPAQELGNAYISDVLHQATVAVDKKGTEASAATAIVLSGLSCDCPAPEPERVVVDRPFLFVIRDNPTGAVLFTGQVVDPTAG